MGAICKTCGQDMAVAHSCTEINLIRRATGYDKRYPKIPYGKSDLFPDNGGRCHDCGVEIGGFHHPMCDWEECPRCHRQLIACGCKWFYGDKDESLKGPPGKNPNPN